METRITTDELEYLAQLFANQMKEETNVEPGYRVVSMGKLESSITQPFQSIEGKELYPTLIDKATTLYYLCIKNHPFEDGNKRMGIFALLLYLFKNGYWLNTTNDELFDITVYTASSKVEDIENVRKKISEFLENHICKELL
ncbi:MAG: type II toxin-antitoxin system death-on-curing family toxin [Candidatus Dojkabacteria bacterium]